MSYIDKVPVWREMRSVGMGNASILIFSTIGLAIWGVLVWMFSRRLVRIDDQDEEDSWWFQWSSVKPLRNITITILAFHVITFVLTLLESHLMSKNVWVSWFTIGLAVSAILLNASAVAITVLDDDSDISGGTEEKVLPDVDMAIASLVLQCIGVSLMTAYLFKIIRSKNKMTY